MHPSGKWFSVVLLLISVSVQAQLSPPSAEQSKTVPDMSTAPDAPSHQGTTQPMDADHQKQKPSDLLPAGADPHNQLVLPFLKHLATDQEQFWVGGTTQWNRQKVTHFLPFVAATGLFIAGDSWITKQVPVSKVDISKTVSDYGVYSLVGAAGGAYLWGHFTQNDHLRETGLLSAEAAINSTAITYVLKGATQRQRPFQGNGNGAFFQGGSSFSSEHSAIAWSIASTVAHEYPGPLTKFLSYGLATAITTTRVTGKQHFASDVIVGSALGWYMARQVYRAHHDPQVGGGPWGHLDFTKEAERPRPDNMASPYEPLDSWVYPAFARLAAMGYVTSAHMDQRPWTRMECARLVEEAADSVPQADAPNDPAVMLYRALSREFAAEVARREGSSNVGASIDSLYARVTGISGAPLRDSFHFGQTLVNDFGRPYGEGSNAVFGISASVVAGPVALFLRSEYQQASGASLYPNNAIQTIAQVDAHPAFPNPTASVSRPEILEGMGAVTFHNVQFSFGKQSAYLGPTRSGSLLMSNNSTPIPMVRIDTVSPYEIPLLSKLLGPAKTEFFIGQLSGQEFISNGTTTFGPNIARQPFIHDDRISFRPTPNLEFGMGISVMFGGQDLPFTWDNYLRTYYAHSPDTAVNPGKRFSGFDFTYRIPGLRKWVTFYNDSLVVDEVSPIGSTRPSLSPGLYFPQIPKVHNLEFRVEGLKTDQAPHPGFGPGFVYADRRYRSGYTNDGNLIGNWIGRAGFGGQAWATYHFSQRNLLEVSYRHAEVDHAFLQGGHTNDFSLSSEWLLPQGLGLSTFFQYERWAFPLLAPQPKTDVTVSFQLTFWPRWSSAAHTLLTGAKEVNR